MKKPIKQIIKEWDERNDRRKKNGEYLIKESQKYNNKNEK